MPFRINTYQEEKEKKKKHATNNSQYIPTRPADDTAQRQAARQDEASTQSAPHGCPTQRVARRNTSTRRPYARSSKRKKSNVSYRNKKKSYVYTIQYSPFYRLFLALGKLRGSECAFRGPPGAGETGGCRVGGLSSRHTARKQQTQSRGGWGSEGGREVWKVCERLSERLTTIGGASSGVRCALVCAAVAAASKTTLVVKQSVILLLTAPTPPLPLTAVPACRTSAHAVVDAPPAEHARAGIESAGAGEAQMRRGA